MACAVRSGSFCSAQVRKCAKWADQAAGCARRGGGSRGMRKSACSTGRTSHSGGCISASSIAEMPSDLVRGRDRARVRVRGPNPNVRDAERPDVGEAGVRALGDHLGRHPVRRAWGGEMEGRCEGGVGEVWGRYSAMQRGVPIAVERLESVVLSCTDTPKSARLGLGVGLGSGLGLGFPP